MTKPQAFELSKEELASRRADMRTWSNLELAQRWAEAAMIAGSLFDWAKWYLPDRDRYTMQMCFVEACLEEFERRDSLEAVTLQ